MNFPPILVSSKMTLTLRAWIVVIEFVVVLWASQFHFKWKVLSFYGSWTYAENKQIIAEQHVIFVLKIKLKKTAHLGLKFLQSIINPVKKIKPDEFQARFFSLGSIAK